MADGAPRVERDGDVVRITMVRAARRNALSRDHLTQLLAAVTEAPPVWGADPEQVRRQVLQVVAVTPTLLAALHRLSCGEQPLAPDAGLDTGADWVRMATGSTPDPVIGHAIGSYLGLTMDHGFNASTFTARVITSTAGTSASSRAGGWSAGCAELSVMPARLACATVPADARDSKWSPTPTVFRRSVEGSAVRSGYR